jgi:hypothetical protein
MGSFTFVCYGIVAGALGVLVTLLFLAPQLTHGSAAAVVIHRRDA